MLVSKYRTLTHDPKIHPRIGPMVTNAEHLMYMASPHDFVLRARIISCCCRLGAEGAHGINQPCKTGAMLYHCCSRLHEQLGAIDCENFFALVKSISDPNMFPSMLRTLSKIGANISLHKPSWDAVQQRYYQKYGKAVPEAGGLPTTNLDDGLDFDSDDY